MMRFFRTLGVAALLALVSIAGAQAQTSYNTYVGAVVTNTLRTAGTTTTAKLNNPTALGVTCTFYQTAHSGSPSTTFAIQGYDSASGSYLSYVTSGAITADTTPTTITVYPGSVATSVPSAAVIAGLHLPAFWRVTQTVGGSAGPATTSTIGCDLLK